MTVVCICVWMEVCFSKQITSMCSSKHRDKSNVPEKPIINAEAVLFLKASKDNKVRLGNQNHMGRVESAYRGSSNNEL